MSSVDRHQEHESDAVATGLRLVKVYVYAAPLFCIGMEEILDDPRFVVSDSASEEADQPSSCEPPAPELVIVDESYSRGAIAGFIAELRARHPKARLVILADHFDSDIVLAAQQAGADGFCLTSSSRDVLIRSIELVMLGETMIPTELILAMSNSKASGAEPLALLDSENRASDIPPKLLSCREMEVLHWLKEGAPNKVIARKLNLAEATVKVHVKNILRKVGVLNRSQAAIWAATHLAADAPVP